MTLKQLYGLDKKGGIKTWNISVEGSVITVEHGKLGGKITSKVSPPCKGKNIGKSNETSPEEQAISEAQSKWQKQVDKGYGVDKDNLPEVQLPPLAKKYQDVKPNLSKETPWLASNKMDGVRCTVFKRGGRVVFQSRGGKEYPVIEDIAKDLDRLFLEKNPQLVVDGELYCHGMFLEDITSCVKKHNPNTEKLKFHVFDVHNIDAPVALSQRVSYYPYIVDNTDIKSSRILPVQQREVTSEEVMLAMHKVAINQGYEGVVLRCPNSMFKFNYRTSEFLKYKEAMREEFQVAGSEVDKNGGGVPVLYLKGRKEVADKYFKETGEWGKADQGVFRANFKGTHKYREGIRKELGDKVDTEMFITVEFEAYSKYGVPLKPISISFREMENGEVVE